MMDGWVDFSVSLTGCTLRGSCNVGRCEAELDVFSLVKISLSPSLTHSLPVSHSPLQQNTWRPGVVTGMSERKWNSQSVFGILLGKKMSWILGTQNFTVVLSREFMLQDLLWRATSLKVVFSIKKLKERPLLIFIFKFFTDRWSNSNRVWP